jgi:hypothetical protein
MAQANEAQVKHALQRVYEAIDAKLGSAEILCRSIELNRLLDASFCRINQEAPVLSPCETPQK